MNLLKVTAWKSSSYRPKTTVAIAQSNHKIISHLLPSYHFPTPPNPFPQANPPPRAPLPSGSTITGLEYDALTPFSLFLSFFFFLSFFLSIYSTHSGTGVSEKWLVEELGIGQGRRGKEKEEKIREMDVDNP